MRKYLFIFCALLITETTLAQLGQTKSYIISAHGYAYQSKFTKDGQPYIEYDSTMYSKESGRYNRTTVYYFDANNICNMQVYFEPLSEINGWVSYLNAHYVKLTELAWKDYSKNINFYVKNLEGTLVAVTFKYDD